MVKARASSRSIIFATKLLFYGVSYVKLINRLNIKNIKNKINLVKFLKIL